MELIKLFCIYTGRPNYVNREDYNNINYKRLLRRYHKNGEKIKMENRTHVHRDNLILDSKNCLKNY